MSRYAGKAVAAAGRRLRAEDTGELSSAVGGGDLIAGADVAESGPSERTLQAAEMFRQEMASSLFASRSAIATAPASRENTIVSVSPGMPSAEAPAALSAAAAKPRKRKDAKRRDAQQPRQKRDPAGILKSISASTLVGAPAKIFLSKAERRKLKKRSKT